MSHTDAHHADANVSSRPSESAETDSMEFDFGWCHGYRYCGC